MNPLVHLDTHVVCWLYDGEHARLSPAAKDALETGRLDVSPMALLEIQYLHEIGRFRDDPDQVLGALGREIGLQVSQTPFPRVLSSARSLNWTLDSFDRLITAQAMSEGARLVTKDRRIREHFSEAVW